MTTQIWLIAYSVSVCSVVSLVVPFSGIRCFSVLARVSRFLFRHRLFQRACSRDALYFLRHQLFQRACSRVAFRSFGRVLSSFAWSCAACCLLNRCCKLFRPYSNRIGLRCRFCFVDTARAKGLRRLPHGSIARHRKHCQKQRGSVSILCVVDPRGACDTTARDTKSHCPNGV